MNSMTSNCRKEDALKCEMAVEVLRSYGRLRLRVNGWSMLPAVFPGDTLVVESAANQPIETGDIVLFLQGGRICVHRIVAKKAGAAGCEILTRGDAMTEADQPLEGAEVLGRVRVIVRGKKVIAPVRRLGLIQSFIAYLVGRSDMMARMLVVSRSCFRTAEPAVA